MCWDTCPTWGWYVPTISWENDSSPRTTVIFWRWFDTISQICFDVVQPSIFRNIPVQWSEFVWKPLFLTRLDELYSTLKLVGVSVFHCFWLIWATFTFWLSKGQTFKRQSMTGANRTCIRQGVQNPKSRWAELVQYKPCLDLCAWCLVVYFYACCACLHMVRLDTKKYESSAAECNWSGRN